MMDDDMYCLFTYQAGEASSGKQGKGPVTRGGKTIGIQIPLERISDLQMNNLLKKG